jgi:Ca-activated chloride channel family protein
MSVAIEETRSGSFEPRNAASGETVRLAMQQLFLTGRILPAGAHLVVHHTFRSAEQQALEVVYCFGLPRDAALRRFEVRGADFYVRSDLKPVARAVEEYEKGLSEGRLSTLARAYGDGLVNLTVGNIRPGEEVNVQLELLAGVELRDDGLRFRFPFTLAPSYHASARAAEIEPGVGEIELPQDFFGDLILPRFQKSERNLHEVSFDISLELSSEIVEVSSPSHSVRVAQSKRVRLAPASDVPNRDLVLDVRTAAGTAATLAARAADNRLHFVSVVPSTAFGETAHSPRSVVFLIDRSGSMSNSPIAQAKKALSACLAALDPEDRFGIVAFDDHQEAFEKRLVPATSQNRAAAVHFLDKIDARGGTELAAGVQAAAAVLENSGGDIFVLTDGQVFGSENILEVARAADVRLHTLGIGSASQDRFLALLARETGGVSRFVTPRERVDLSALDLFASVSAPVATSLDVSGGSAGGASISPDPPGVIFAGTPLILYGDCESGGAIRLQFENSGARKLIEIPVQETPGTCGETLRLLRGARLITDAEARFVRGGNSAAAGREQRRQEEYLERLAKEYGLANRTMALVAVVQREGDRAGAPPKTTVVPVGLPQDTEFSGVFGATGFAAPMAAAMPDRSMNAPNLMRRIFSHRGRLPHQVSEGSIPDSHDYCYQVSAKTETASFESPVGTDPFVDLAASLEPDGGMPGSTPEYRLPSTALALLAFGAAGHWPSAGPFRVHLRRMLEYIERFPAEDLSSEQREILAKVLDAVRRERVIAGAWMDTLGEVLAEPGLDAGRIWEMLQSAM